MARATNPRKRERGRIDELPSGALRVRVYAGTDPITKRRHDLVEVIPAGPKAWDRADEVRRRFVADGVTISVPFGEHDRPGPRQYARHRAPGH